MKQLKIFNLLQVREKLKQNKSISDLQSIEADSKKCQDISEELEKLLSEDQTAGQKIQANSFVSNRILMQKMLDQKSIINNRLDFLKLEKISLMEMVTLSKVKTDFFEKRKKIIKQKLDQKSFEKHIDEVSQIKRQR